MADVRLALVPLVVAGALAALTTAGGSSAAAQLAAAEWRVYGGSPASDRFSPLAEITPANVARLEEAWRFDTGETGGFQVNPIVVDSVLYSPTPNHRVVALDAATGALKWTFDSKLESRGPNRGVTYWASGDERRLFVAADQYLYALDARTGIPVSGFADRGRIDLRRDLGRAPASQSIRLTTPGIVYRELLIVGGRAGRRRRSFAGGHPGVRRAHGRAAVVVPHDSASRRDRLRYLVRDVMEGERRRQQLGRHGARRVARGRVRAHRIGRAGLPRGRPHRRQPVRELPACARCRDRTSHLALPGGASRHLGSRLPVAPHAGHGPPRRQADRRGGADHQARLRVRARSRDRRATVPGRRETVPCEHRARRTCLEDAARAAIARSPSRGSSSRPTS